MYEPDSLMTQRVNELVAYTVWVSHYQSYICPWMCARLYLCSYATVSACVQLCVKLASSSRVMNQIKHLHTLPAVDWAEGSWSGVALIPLQLQHPQCFSAALLHVALGRLTPGLKLLCSDPQIELDAPLDTKDAPVVTVHSVCSNQIWKLQIDWGLWGRVAVSVTLSKDSNNSLISVVSMYGCFDWWWARCESVVPVVL